jgi:hypothetical protein
MEELMEAKVLRISPRALEGIEDCTNGVKKATNKNRK